MPPNLNVWLGQQYRDLDDSRLSKYARGVLEEDKVIFPQVFRASREGLGGASRQLFAHVVSHSVSVTREVYPELHQLFPRFRPLPDDRPDPRLGFLNWILASLRISANNNGEAFLEVENNAEADDERLAVEYLQDLPVSLLPLNSALSTNGPPQFGTLLEEEQDMDTNKKITKVFVSHRWAEFDKPSVGDEWTKLKLFFTQLINDCLLACSVLLHSEFPLSQWLDNIHGDERQHLVFHRGITVTLRTHGEHRIKVDRRLAQTVFLTAAAEVAARCTNGGDISFRNVFAECGRPIAKRIFLWYDFCCLPQNLNNRQRTPEQDLRFRRTLQLLPNVQASMDTLLLDLNDTYDKRAWCVAESTNAPHCSQWRSMCRAGNWPQAEISWMDRPCKVLQVLLNPATTSLEALDKLQLEFTDDAHTKYDDIICWIFWNAVVSCDIPPRWTTHFRDRETVVGVGTRGDVIQWFRFVEQALRRSRETKPLNYDFASWQRLRDRAFQCTSRGDVSQERSLIAVVRDLNLDRQFNLFDKLAGAFCELANELADDANEEYNDEQASIHVSIVVRGEEEVGGAANINHLAQASGLPKHCSSAKLLN